MKTEKLLQAAALLDEVRRELDDSGKQCGSCGLHVKANFPEASLAQQLMSMATKLRRFAAQPAATGEEGG